MRNGVLITVAAILVTAAGCGSSAPAPRAQHLVVSATLTGASTLPKGERHASGAAVLGLNTNRQKICWTITIAGLHAPVSAHLRKAPAHKVGPVIVSFGQRFVRSGCAPASSSVITDLGAHPSAYYVDVVSRQNPNGALRGQLRAGS